MSKPTPRLYDPWETENGIILPYLRKLMGNGERVALKMTLRGAMDLHAEVYASGEMKEHTLVVQIRT